MDKTKTENGGVDELWTDDSQHKLSSGFLHNINEFCDFYS